jgi:acetyltransferase-like isoleucine patch superfamily enzyme
MSYSVHPAALVESEEIGPRTRIWAHVHIMRGVVIGADCNICDGCFLESGARVGNGVTLKIGVAVCEGVTLGDGVFVGPHVMFTNDQRPRSPRLLPFHERYRTKGWLAPTTVEVGATLGANATIACGIRIGAWAFVAAGAVVMRDVAPHAFMVGNPARPVGHVCVCAAPLIVEESGANCSDCGRGFRWRESVLEAIDPIQLWPEKEEREPWRAPHREIVTPLRGS